MSGDAPGITLLDVSDPESRAEVRQRRERAVVHREALIQKARVLLNRAKLRGSYRIPSPGDDSTVYVMRPDTLDFLLSGQTPMHEGPKEFAMGAAPTFDGVPVYFSDELEPGEIILAYKGWPYFSADDLKPMDHEV
jgi:hypothetical protein